MAKKYNCTINGKQYYRITKTVGHKADGTPIKKPFYGDGEKDAINKADEYINKLKTGMSLDFENVSIDELIYKWLFQIKLNELKPSSFQSYEGTYRNYIKNSELATLKVFNTKSIHIQEYYNKLGKSKTFSQIKKLNKLLKQFFSYAEKEGYIIKNPCNNITIPNQNENIQTKSDSIDYFNEEEIKALKLAFKGNKFEPLILTALGTGLRQGELLALKWKNIDLKNNILYVKESIKKVYVFDSNGNKHLETLTQTPKSINSIRTIDLPEKISKIFSNLPHNSEYVFSDENRYTLFCKNTFWKLEKSFKR